jgi:predicted phage baseplate assembly protein
MNEPCDCCEGTEQVTPESIMNRPGLDALVYRIGRHATFLESMKAALTALPGLQTRAADDPSIALLDAWATVADVLTFYQERIANEGYLRTATERRSVLELARLVGYRLRPGVSASVYLAFLMENNAEGIIPVGTRAQSLPGPGELPQSFETSEQITARAAWNQMRLRTSRPQRMKKEIVELKKYLYFKGTSTGLQVNAPLVIDYGSQSQLYRVTAVHPELAAERTRVEFELWNPPTNPKPPPVGKTPLDVWLEAAMRDRNQFNLLSPDAELLIEENEAFKEGLLQLNPDALTTPDLAPDGAFDLEAFKRAAQVQQPSAAQPPISVQLQLAESSQRQQIVSRLMTILQMMEMRLDTLNIVQASEFLADYRWRFRAVEKQAFNDAFEVFEGTLQSGIPSRDDPLFTSLMQLFRRLSDEVDLFVKSVNALGLGDDGSFREWVVSCLRRIEAAGMSLLTGGGKAQASVGVRSLNQSQRVGTVASPQSAPIAMASNIVSLMSTASFNELPTWVLQGSLKPIAIAIPPRNSADRRLDANDLLRESGDARLKTITAFNPQARRQMYVALGGTPSLAVNPVRVYAFRTTASLFGHNAIVESDTRLEPPATPVDWTPRGEFADVLWLDNVYDKIAPRTPIVLVNPDNSSTPVITNVVTVQEKSRSDYRLNGKRTRLTVENGKWTVPTSFDIIRGTTVYAQAEALELAEMPVINALTRNGVELNAVMDGLEPGRWIIVAGERIDVGPARGVRDAELVMIGKVEHSADDTLSGDRAVTKIEFVTPLRYRFKQDTVAIYGNVVKATHGETRTEIMGSGDGSQSFQFFKLKQSPVTYLAVPTPEGAVSTLEVRVNDLLWHEEVNLMVQAADDRSFVTHIDDEDKMTVTFGDGEHGSRLPTGSENVRAKYRTGIGKPGNVSASKISLLATRPLGVQGVTNPLRASGGADRENRDQARRNIPLATTSLGRIISIEDYANFARTFAGIGKAHVVRLVSGAHTLVYLTITGTDDIPIDITSDLYLNLVDALSRYGDPYQAVDVVVRDLMALVIGANVSILPDYEWDKVKARIERRLLDHFSFERRELGQDVTRSEVISVIQAVPGVAYVDLEKLDRLVNYEETSAGTSMEDRQAAVASLSLRGRIVARLPSAARISPAQLVYLRPELTETLAINRITQ